MLLVASLPLVVRPGAPCRVLAPSSYSFRANNGSFRAGSVDAHGGRLGFTLIQLLNSATGGVQDSVETDSERFGRTSRI